MSEASPVPPPQAGKLSRWEHRTAILLNRCLLLDVITIQLSDFEAIYGEKAETIWLARKLRAAWAKELMAAGFPASAAVHEHQEVNDVPIIFGDLEQGFLLRICGVDPRKEVTL